MEYHHEKFAIQSNPIQSNPIQSNPIQSNPIQSNPIQSNPIQSNPMRKLCLAITATASLLLANQVWACERLKVSGYDDVGCLNENSAWVWVKKDRKYGFLDKAGNIIVPPQYDAAGDYEEGDGLAWIRKDGKYGFIDKTGKIVASPQYDRIGELREGALWVRKNSQYGIFDKTGKMVAPLQYDYIDDFKEGLAKVKKDGKYGFIDKTGKVIASLYDSVRNFSEGLARVKKDGKWGFFDKTGKMVIPLQYEDSYSVEKGDIFAYVRKDSRSPWIYVSKLGNEYTKVGKVVVDGLVWVEKDNKEGFVDQTGKEVVPLQDGYSFDNFSEGLAEVCKGGKCGFIDKTGKVVIPLQYDGTDSFSNGRAQVRLYDGKTPQGFYIDKTGKVLTKRVPLDDFRKQVSQGDDVYYKTNDDSGWGMILEIKGNLVQIQIEEEQCTQRDYKGNCQNYVKNPASKWVKRSEIYADYHFKR